MTKKELLEENEELKEALGRIREEIGDLIGQDDSDEDDPEDEDEESGE